MSCAPARRSSGSYVGQHLNFAAQEQRLRPEAAGLQINDRVDGSYAWLPFVAQCPAAVRHLSIRYSMLHDIDPSHRGLLTLTAGSFTQSGVLGGTMQRAAFAVYAPSKWRTFAEYLQAGIWHIWSGIDHLLFLLSLLLPAVLIRRQRHWEPVTAPARPSSASSKSSRPLPSRTRSPCPSPHLDVVRLPSRLTESVIAASIIVAALNNIFPLVTDSRARIAFAFGLLHGFGFASVLADMGLPHGRACCRCWRSIWVSKPVSWPWCWPSCRSSTGSFEPVLPPRGAAVGLSGDRRAGTGMAGAAGAAAHRLRW